jgi:hypothetical protein
MLIDFHAFLPMDGPDDVGTSHFAISTLMCSSDGFKTNARSLDPMVVGPRDPRSYAQIYFPCALS